AARSRNGWVSVASGPRLDARVEIHRASFPAELDERNAGDLDRHIQNEVSTPHQRRQNPPKVLSRQRLLVELDAVLLGFLPTSVGRCDDRDALGCNADMPQEERQDTLPDTAKANDENPPWEIDIDLVVTHFINARYQ